MKSCEPSVETVGESYLPPKSCRLRESCLKRLADSPGLVVVAAAGSLVELGSLSGWSKL